MHRILVFNSYDFLVNLNVFGFGLVSASLRYFEGFLDDFHFQFAYRFGILQIETSRTIMRCALFFDFSRSVWANQKPCPPDSDFLCLGTIKYFKIASHRLSLIAFGSFPLINPATWSSLISQLHRIFLFDNNLWYHVCGT